MLDRNLFHPINDGLERLKDLVSKPQVNEELLSLISLKQDELSEQAADLVIQEEEIMARNYRLEPHLRTLLLEQQRNPLNHKLFRSVTVELQREAERRLEKRSGVADIPSLIYDLAFKAYQTLVSQSTDPEHLYNATAAMRNLAPYLDTNSRLDVFSLIGSTLQRAATLTEDASDERFNNEVKAYSAKFIHDLDKEAVNAIDIGNLEAVPRYVELMRSIEPREHLGNIRLAKYYLEREEPDKVTEVLAGEDSVSPQRLSILTKYLVSGARYLAEANPGNEEIALTFISNVTDGVETTDWLSERIEETKAWIENRQKLTQQNRLVEEPLTDIDLPEEDDNAKQCSNCGKVVPESGSKFCNACGSPLGSV